MTVSVYECWHSWKARSVGTPFVHKDLQEDKRREARAECDTAGLKRGTPVKRITEITKGQWTDKRTWRRRWCSSVFSCFMAWKSLGWKTKIQNDKGWRMKRKIVKEWVNVVHLGNYSMLFKQKKRKKERNLLWEMWWPKPLFNNWTLKLVLSQQLHTTLFCFQTLCHTEHSLLSKARLDQKLWFPHVEFKTKASQVRLQALIGARQTTMPFL